MTINKLSKVELEICISGISFLIRGFDCWSTFSKVDKLKYNKLIKMRRKLEKLYYDNQRTT